MLEPLDNLTLAGKYPFEDGAAYPNQEFGASFSLADQWRYEYTPYFDGVPKKDIEQHSDFSLTEVSGEAQKCIDTKAGRIDGTFGKSWNLRYFAALLTDLHQPMHNIIRYSSSHPDGDDFGKLHSIKGDYKTLYDLFDDAFGQYKELSYPLTDIKTLDGYVDQIMADFPKSEFSKEVQDEKKSKWTKASYKIATSFAYTLEENGKYLAWLPSPTLNIQSIIYSYSNR